MNSIIKMILSVSLLALSLQALAQETAPAAAVEAAPADTAPVAPLATTPPEMPAAATTPEQLEAQARNEEEQFRDSREDQAKRNREGVAVLARVGTLGLGVDVIKNISKRINLRAQGNFFDYNKSLKKEDLDYAGKLKFQTFGLLADFYPMQGVPVIGLMRFSVGAYANNNKVDLSASCKDANGCKIGDDVIVKSSNPNNPPTISGGINFNKFSPYLGIGFGNAFRGWPVTFSTELGVLLQGAPKFNLAASGSGTVTKNGVTTPSSDLSTNQELKDALRVEEKNASEKSKEFKFYPVINFSIGYRFNFL